MREQIFLSKNYTVIESDIPFTLKFNIKDNTAASAEDIINFKSGWYIFDNNKLLPQYVDGVYNLPKYNCWIEYNILPGGTKPRWYTCYINPKSVESLSAEQTELDPAQLAILRQDIQINGAKVDSFAAATHEDLGAVKSSVDALQTSNHSDLGAVKSSVDSFKSDLFDGIPGVTEPLSFYLNENIKFAKESRLLLSPNPFAFGSDWSYVISDVPYNGSVGVFLPFQMDLLFRLSTGGATVAQIDKHFPAGAYIVFFGESGGNFIFKVSGLEVFTYDFGVSVVPAHDFEIYTHKIDVYS